MVIINERMAVVNDMDNPPSYEQCTDSDGGIAAALESPKAFKASDSVPSPTSQPLLLAAGPSMPSPAPYGAVHTPPVHQYRSANGEIVYGLLPPDHPEMICLQQGHEPNTHYGLLGIIAAFVWFPLGIGLCLLDRRVKCQRCNHIIAEGLCA